MPAKADPDEQAAFLKDELRPRLDQAERGKRTVLFVDAAHFVYGPFLAYVWCLVRLFVPGPSGRKRYNVLAALNAVTHDVIRVTNHGYINALSVCELLAEVAAARLPGKVTLVMDNARYQRCELVKQEARRLGIELLFLPAYSPNLNLIERLWKFVKKECLSCRYYEDFARFRGAIVECLDGVEDQHQSSIRSLLTLNFQTFEEPQLLAG